MLRTRRELYLFGFSRGAFTARSVAGFVRNAGILRPEHAGRLADAYALYRSRGAHPVSTEATLSRRTYSYKTRIRSIEGWDRVGALGIPVNGLRLLNRRNQFHDVAISSTVDAASKPRPCPSTNAADRSDCSVGAPDVDIQVVEQA